MLVLINTYKYDGLNQLISDIVQSLSGANIENCTFKYDGNMNVLQKEVNGLATDYSYNSIKQPIYDINGRLKIDGEGNKYSYDDIYDKLKSIESIDSNILMNITLMACYLFVLSKDTLLNSIMILSIK